MIVNKIDHIVMTVRNINTFCEFYSRVLGMDVVTFGNERTALVFGDQRINLHEIGKEFEPKALNPTPGSADLCLVTNIHLEQVIKHLNEIGVSAVEGPVIRTGACGAINSVYINDPDGNLIEISNYIG